MKRKSIVVLLLTLLLGTSLSAWAQSTQGKDFWVSSTLVCSPDKANPAPYIAISAEKACTVTITGGLNNAINITQKVAAGSWNEFGNGTTSQTNPAAGMIKVPMDASKWYPTSINDANSVLSLAGQKNMYGLHITATEEISVYVILSSMHSMDASNILPMTALGSEYYTQDYWSKVKSDFANAVGLTTILGTEDNTTVKIIPNGNTYDGHQSGQVYTITLNKGQTYYMVTQKGDRLAGSHIMAEDGRKIAVYCGVPLTNIPTGIAARDCLFEQSMPVDYWGTQFIVTRSLEKNGNLIGITATQPSTEIKVDGYTQGSINEGETYYIMLQGPNDPNGKNPGTSPIDLVVTADAAYIETSCPSAVYSYDTGNSYKGDDDNTSEIVNGKGDPSSVWVSPIQQKIGKITFGTCYTTKTEDHFLNVVTETATCADTKLTALYGASEVDKTSLLVWTPVPGNTAYSYARAHIGTSATKQYSVFRLENSHGFTATVYGNGEDESYAYSAGSAAVEQGVYVDGETFTNGYRSETKFCVNTDMSFDAKVGTDEIARVDWNFGDGTSEYNGQPQTTHQYTTPGWYDVSAEIYGRKVCTNETDKWLGSVQFAFRVVEADTVIVDPAKVCWTIAQKDSALAAMGQEAFDSLILYGRREIINPDAACYEDKQLSLVIYGYATDSIYYQTEKDSAYINGQWYTLENLPADGKIEWTISGANQFGCDSIVTCYLKIVSCLDIILQNIPDSQYVCNGDNMTVEYTIRKGELGPTTVSFDGETAVEIDPESTYALLPTEKLKPGKHHADINIQDTVCDRTITLPYDFSVYYPSNIFVQKFNNVLAVYKKNHGGNTEYDFTAYQWYYNGAPIEGATESVYHVDGKLATGSYYVVLTRSDMGALPSCPINVVSEYLPEYDQQNNSPAKKMLIDNRMVIRMEDKVYNMYGQRVQ